MNNDIISVVVPVYNVERYLPRCLERLLHQTYPHLDIILVDDGSEDESSRICEKYREKDSRIRVFHKKNGGLSDARNYGLKELQGPYVTFVDSDDYVAETYVEFLYYLLKKEEADIAVCGYLETTRSDEQAIGSAANMIMDGKSAVKNMFYQKYISTSACAKLYRSSLFQQIEFPYGRLYEDVNTVYKVLLKAEKVAYSQRIEYFYFNRPQSIVHSDFQKRKMDYIKNTQDVMIDMKDHCPELFPAAVSRFLWANLHILAQMPKKGYPEERERVIDNIKCYRGMVLKDPQVRLQNKILLIICLGQGTLVRWLYQGKKKRLKIRRRLR